MASIVLLLGDMLSDTLEIFRRRLLGRRFSVLQRRQRALADEQELLAEHEPDWEDVAAAQTAATVLESLSETERVSLGRIQAALDRIERGTYGYCAVCGSIIDEERLRSVPETDRCGGCAAAAAH